jgi:hypothetical protein
MHCLPSGTSKQQQMLQFIEEQRREDHRMADEREVRYQRAAEEREEQREVHYEAQLAALTVKATANIPAVTPLAKASTIYHFFLGPWDKTCSPGFSFSNHWPIYCTHPLRTLPGSCA